MKKNQKNQYIVCKKCSGRKFVIVKTDFGTRAKCPTCNGKGKLLIDRLYDKE
jgi:DnaJ-class molecular chaperone